MKPPLTRNDSTRVLTVIFALALSGCATADQATIPRLTGQPGDVFVTLEDIKEPYESMGVVQVTRRGVLLFGFADPAGTDLQAAMDELVPQIRRAGADGVINARVQQVQYTPIARIFGAIFFFAPLPAEVTVTGELVRLRRAGAPQPIPAPVAPPGAPL